MVFGAREGTDISWMSCWCQVTAVLCSAQTDNWRSSVTSDRCLGGTCALPCAYGKLAKPLCRNQEEMWFNFLIFFFFGSALSLASFPLPGDSKHFRCYMVIPVLLVVQCSFFKLYCAHLACYQKFLERHWLQEGKYCEEGLHFGFFCLLF